MRAQLNLFLKWGITFGKTYEIAEKSARKVEYAERRKVEEEIIRRNVACEAEQKEDEADTAASGGMAYTPVPAIKLSPMEQKQESSRR